MGTRCKCLCNFLGCTDGADWHAAAECLSHGDDIRLNAIVHIAHDLAGSAPTGLNLINQKKHSVFIAELAKSSHKFLCCRMDTALALYWLNHDGDGVFRAGILKGL